MNNFTSYRARFRGDLAGIKVNDLGRLDYNITTIENRKKFIENKLDEVMDFFIEYFDIKIVEDDEGKRDIAYFNYSPNVTDELSIDINICKYIENYANYMLNSKDLPRERQQKYNILSEEDFKKILQKELPLSHCNKSDNEDNEDSIDILDTRRENDYINLDFKITNSDFNDPGVMDVLISYQVLKDYLKAQLELIKNKEEAEIDLFKAKRILAGINDDMILSKIKLKQIRSHARRLGDESPMNDMSEIDYTNPEHIKAILRNCTFREIEPNNEMSLMAYDMEVAIRELYKSNKLDDIDLRVVELYNQGVVQREISKIINRDLKTTNQRIEKIIKRVVEYFEIGELLVKIKKIK